MDGSGGGGGGKLQWFSMRGNGGSAPAGQQGGPAFGNGALRFIRTRASARAKRASPAANRSKSGEKGAACHQSSSPSSSATTATVVSPSSATTLPTSTSHHHDSVTTSSPPHQGGGGGFGRWLREHLTVTHHHQSAKINDGKLSKNQRQLQQLQLLPSQNLYCSLPRERPARRFDHRRASCRIVTREVQQQHQQVVLVQTTEDKDEGGRRRSRTTTTKAERRRHSMSEFHSEQHRSSVRRSRRCFPDGGEVGYKMTTELQPSPPGYRGAGKDECAPGGKLYSRHLGYNGAGPEYPRRRESQSPEQVTELGAKIVDGYEEQGNYCKKNAPGYKNDSGYSESLGFESFSLPLNERDAASPPPTPPVRDASSLKGVCYGPGHEKYPSWPSAPECRYTSGNEDDEDGPGQASLQQHAGGSHRSKSWTDHTNYPKEKPAQYTRPHTKRPNATFTQQLKTVMERCEKIPAETFESRPRGDPDQQQQLRMWPSVDREGKTLGDAEYVVPSPPERESHQAKTLSPADLEAYVRSYQDPQVSQVELYGESDLTQTGLDEYTTVQHSQQASYAQSEGYHSYVSSVDSTTTTPFLDRLRRDSEAVTQRPLTSWEDGSSREGRDSVVTTSSGSASSSETLKWHGSMSDVSVSSGMPTSRSSGIAQDRWHHGSMSDVSSINGAGPMVHKPDDHDKWQDSIIDNDHHHGHQNNHHHSSSKRDNWQVSMNDRNKEHGSATEDKWEHSGHAMSKSFHSVLDRSSIITDQSGCEWEHSIHSSMSDVSQTNGSGGTTQGSKQLIAHSSRVQTPQRHHSESVLYLDRERSQRKLYPVSTTKLDEAHTVSRLPASSPQQAQPSVAERINELEKQQHLQQQQMRYTYLDPDKRHRVSDPTLKAIQKKALLSFYERHQHQASWRSEPHLLLQNQQLSQQRHSPPPQPPPRPRPVSSRRASSASDYASGGWREKSESSKAAPQQQPSSTSSGGSSSAGNSDLPTPKHQHSNSCGSLSTDLLGPVIVGPAISIDDWVPERPPKKPHLRSAFSDRLPSPDLPPPSPPTVTDVEVINFDDPLPPPPPELSQICTAEPRMASPEQRRDNSYFEEPPSDRIKERNSSSRRSSRKKHIVETTSPTNSPTKSKSSSPKQDQHSFHFECKPLPESKSHVETSFSASRLLASGRSSLRFSSTQKHMLNEKIAAVRRAAEDRLAPYGLADQLPDLIAQKYSDSGNQRPAPQVPVGSREAQAEPKIKRQESLSLDETKQSWLDAHSARQKPRPQAPKTSPTSPTSPPINHRGSSKYQQQRTYFALPPKYTEAPKPQSPPSHERYGVGEAASAPVAAPRSSPPPPPLAPRKKMSPPPRPAPPLHAIHQGSQSKASYLAYRRERGAPDSEGSYKRTMSPNARLDDPVLLKVTPHHQQSLLNNNNTSSSHNNNNNNNNPNNNNNNNVNNVNNTQYHGRHHRHELSKSQSSDALQQHHNSHQPHHNSQHHHRLDDHFSRKSMHNVSSSTDLDNSRSLENVNSRSEENGLRRTEKRERLSPQSVEVLNDRNRQLERERRKLAASCEPQSRLVEDFYRESAVTTIEMTSQNVEMLNRRNVAEKQRVAAAEGRSPTSSSPKFSESPTSRSPPTTTTTSTSTEPISDRKVSSPAQTDQSGSSWDRKSTSTISSSSSSSRSNSNSSSPLRTSPSESQVEKSSPRVSPQPGIIEGLTLVQRTEVMLRVNAPTNDVASQTETPDEVNEDNKNKQQEDETTAKEEKLTESLAKPRKKLPEEIECEELSRDLANQLGPNDKLLPILVPVPEHKKSTDYVSDLFRVETALQPRPRPRLSIEEPTLLEDNEPEDAKKIDSIPTTPVTPSATDSSATANSPLSASSAYFTTSEGKARFLTRYSQDVGVQQNATATNGNGGGNSSVNATPDSIDLRQKKEELMVRLDKKLVVLRAEQEAVREEGDVNEALGARVSSRVSAVAQPAEASKYRLHVEEVGKITSLLLSLSGRLARAENALYGMPADHAERKILESKRDKLMDQLEEAKILKGNIDRRSVNVSALLSRYLTDEEFADYQHFINMKAKLIVDGREIQDKVKLGEEQLAALKEAIDL